MSLVELFVRGISHSRTEIGAYTLLLEEIDGDRTLPIVIGNFEAQSISIALQKIAKPTRPLTHDLFKNFADSFDIIVKQIIIHKLVEGIFYSSIICERDRIEEIIDARTSDAVALALRFNAPVFTYQNILDNAGFHLRIEPQGIKTHIDDDDYFDLYGGFKQSSKHKKENYDNHTIEELQMFLKTAVQNEDYENAVQIRDEISKREKK